MPHWNAFVMQQRMTELEQQKQQLESSNLCCDTPLAKAVTKVTAFLCFLLCANGHRAGREVSQRLLHKGCQRCQIVIRRMQADGENARDACNFEETNGGRAILWIGAQIAFGHHADSRFGKQAGHTW